MGRKFEGRDHRPVAIPCALGRIFGIRHHQGGVTAFVQPDGATCSGGSRRGGRPIRYLQPRSAGLTPQTYLRNVSTARNSEMGRSFSAVERSWEQEATSTFEVRACSTGLCTLLDSTKHLVMNALQSASSVTRATFCSSGMAKYL